MSAKPDLPHQIAGVARAEIERLREREQRLERVLAELRRRAAANRRAAFRRL